MAETLKKTLEEQLEKFSSYSIIANPLIPSQKGTPLDLRQKATPEQRDDIIQYNLGYPGLISYDPSDSKFYFCTADNNFKLMNENNFAGVSQSFKEVDLIDNANYEILDVDYKVGSELMYIRDAKRYDIPKLSTPYKLLDYEKIYVLNPDVTSTNPKDKYDKLMDLELDQTSDAWWSIYDLSFIQGNQSTDEAEFISIGDAPDIFIGHKYDGNGNIQCTKIFKKDDTPIIGYAFKCIGIGGCLNYELDKCYDDIKPYPVSENYYWQMFAIFSTDDDKKPGYGSVVQAMYEYKTRNYIAALWRNDSLWQIKKPIHEIFTTEWPEYYQLTDFAYIVNGTNAETRWTNESRKAHTDKGSLILGYKQKNGNWEQDTGNYVYCFVDDVSNNYFIYSIEGNYLYQSPHKILNTIINEDDISETDGVMLLGGGGRSNKLTSDDLKKYIFTTNHNNYYAIRWENSISKLYPVFNTAFDSNNWNKNILNGLYLITQDPDPDQKTVKLTPIEAMQNKIVAQYERDETSKWYFIQKNESNQQYEPIWVYNDQMTKDLTSDIQTRTSNKHITYTEIEKEQTRQLAVKELNTDDYNITIKNIRAWKEGDIAKYHDHWYFWTQKNSDNDNNGWKLIQNGYAIYQSEHSQYSESNPTYFKCDSNSLLGILEKTNKNPKIKTVSEVHGDNGSDEKKNLHFLGEIWVWADSYQWKQATQSHFIIKNHEFALIESVWTELELKKAFEKLNLDVSEFITVVKDGVSTQSWSKNYLGDQILNILQGDVSSEGFKKKDEIINAFANLGFVSNLPNIKQNSTTQLGIPTAKKALNKKTNDLGQEEESYIPLEVETLNLKRHVNQRNTSTWTNEEVNKALRSGVYFSHGTDMEQLISKENNYLLFTENVYTQNNLYDERRKQVNQVLVGSNIKFRSSLPYISETPQWTEWEEFKWSDVVVNNKTNAKPLVLQSITPTTTETNNTEGSFRKTTTIPTAASVSIDQNVGVNLEYHKPITTTITESFNDNEEMVVTTVVNTPLKSTLILDEEKFRAEITEARLDQLTVTYDADGNEQSRVDNKLNEGTTTSWEMQQGEYQVILDSPVLGNNSKLKLTNNDLNFTAQTRLRVGQPMGHLKVDPSTIYAYTSQYFNTSQHVNITLRDLWESFMTIEPKLISWTHQRSQLLGSNEPTVVQSLKLSDSEFTLNESPILTKDNFATIMGDIGGGGGDIDTSNLVPKAVQHPHSPTGETLIENTGEYISLTADEYQASEYAGIKIYPHSLSLWGFNKNYKLCIDEEGLSWNGKFIPTSDQVVYKESKLGDYIGFIGNESGEVNLFHMNPANTYDFKINDEGMHFEAWSGNQQETSLNINESGVEINKLNIRSRIDIVNDETIYGSLDWGNIGDEWGLYINEQFALIDSNDDFPYMSTQRWNLLFGSLSDSENSPAPIKFNLHSDNPSICIKGLAIQNDNGSLMVGGDTVMTDTTFHEQAADFAKIIDLTNATIINTGGAE